MTTDNSLGKAFIAALLLTGSMEQAETAVLEGIRFLDPDDEPGEALLSHTVSAAFETRPERLVSPGGLERSSAVLPRELHSVMRLSPDIRHCFVLRVLVGWSRELCARLLRLEIRQIDERTRIAMLKLAYLTM